MKYLSLCLLFLSFSTFASWQDTFYSRISGGKYDTNEWSITGDAFTTAVFEAAGSLNLYGDNCEVRIAGQADAVSITVILNQNGKIASQVKTFIRNKKYFVTFYGNENSWYYVKNSQAADDSLLLYVPGAPVNNRIVVSPENNEASCTVRLF